MQNTGISLAQGNFKLIHRTADVANETDYAGTQGAFPTDFVIIGEVQPGWLPALQIFYIWVDQLSPDVEDISTRGTATVQFIQECRVVPAVTGGTLTAGVPTTFTTETTGVAITSYQPLVLDEVMPGDKIGLRFTAMTPSTGAEYLACFGRLISK